MRGGGKEATKQNGQKLFSSVESLDNALSSDK